MTLDVADLQQRLRAFAAARQWQPYHTPKNLAMALMVEAAEESQQLTADPAHKERVGEEIADVLLYLLQLADHTGVDLRDAVERKLVKNAIKHPEPPAGPAAVD